ncbi:MAG: HD domain-containing protein [Candidatus Hodarchaeota archaeon]
MDATLIQSIEKFAFDAIHIGKRGAHSYEHTLRVRELCRFIGAAEGADLEILEAAALLHDIGRSEEEVSGVSHAEIGANMAVAFLATTTFSKEKLSLVASAIRTHRFSEQLSPESLEGQILSDADKLDAMGALGLARTIAESLVQQRGLKGTIEHIHRKLLKLNALLHTKTAKQLAAPRHQLLVDFMTQLAAEYQTIGEPLPPELQNLAPSRTKHT